MPSVTPETRASAIERFVLQDAVSELVIELIGNYASRSTVLDSETVRLYLPRNPMEDISGELYEALWPEEEDLNSDEGERAQAQAKLIAAGLMIELAASASRIACRAREMRSAALKTLAETGA